MAIAYAVPMRLLFCLALLLTSVRSQVNAAEAASLSEVPFEFRDSLIWVRVWASSEPLDFLLDSGAGMSVINLPTLQRIGRLQGRRITVHGVEATTTGYWPQRLALRAGALPLAREFLAVDLSQLSRACNRTVDGLIGADFFRDRVVQIDFAARAIRLLPSSVAAPGQITLPLEARGRALHVPVSVNGGPEQWVRLDTGCAAALHWVTASIQPEACRPQLSVALTSLVIPMMDATVQMGAVKFASVPTGVHQRRIFSGEAGLLGNGLLSRFNSVTIDSRSERVVFEQTSAHAGS